MLMREIITRFAPSPTGYLHIGGVRTALFNYLYAKQNKGKIYLRIEDTDTERNKEEYTQGIINGFDWLGLKFDQTVKQSDNFPTHKKYLEKLIKDGYAYISKEEVKEEGQRSEVIRFKNPKKKITFDDMIKGEITFDTTDLGDFIIAKSLEEPIFHLSNVIDDITMGITHVIRGEEHISNTPRQILIWEAIGERSRPVYGHIPLILSKEREKISKRKHGEIVAIEYYRNKGYLPEAILNFLAFLGWNPGNDIEIMSLDELIKRFDISKVQKAGAIFNTDKLNWYNSEYLKKLDNKTFLNISKSFWPENILSDDERISNVTNAIKSRISCLSDIGNLFNAGSEFGFISNYIIPTADKVLWKKEPSQEKTKVRLEKVLSILESINEDNFNETNIKDALWKFAESEGKGEVLWPMRMAITGLDKSPDPFISASIIGKDETIQRIKKVISIL
jgi:glutamyl-tRNA synthetase